LLIGGRNIGRDHAPFVIAEMSGNHNQSLARALELVDAAAGTGVHAIKLQTFTADTITLDVREGEFCIDDGKSLWNGQNLFDLYKVAHTPWDWHAPIMQRAREHGILCFTSPFDETAVDYLETLNVPAYKIASPEILHLPLIRKVAATGRPLIISTGMATLAEIDEAVRAARGAGCRDLALLKCTSTYPALPLDTNVLTIPHMRDLYDCEVGLSDHTMGIGASVAAVAHGASMVEKHFTLRRADGGVDSTFSLEPAEMRALVVETERAWQSLGEISYGPTTAELQSLKYRRSLYIAVDVKAGDVLTHANLRCVRPGLGLAPKYYDVLLGHRVKRDARKGTPMQWELLE
jgi:pseudaminic acid synthase